MGMTEVQLTIKNPQNGKKSITGDYLVDSGAAYTVVPADIVSKLKLKPRFKREFTLADGKKVTRQIGEATVGFGNEEITTPVILGQKEDTALLGVLTLETFGLALDPFKRKLYKAKMML